MNVPFTAFSRSNGLLLTKEGADDARTGSIYGQGAGTLLEEGELRAYDLMPGTEVEIFLLTGQAWITLEGEMTDHVLASGDRLRLKGAGKLVLEALEDLTELMIWSV